MQVPQIITYAVVEKRMEHKGEKTKVSFGRAIMQTLELQRLVKTHLGMKRRWLVKK